MIAEIRAELKRLGADDEIEVVDLGGGKAWLRDKRGCPACGSEDVSGDHPQHILDKDGPNPRLVCEGCGHKWVEWT